MSDRVFSGRDVAEALELAGSALGLPKERLRYFVLDTGTAGGLGLKATPARVAVLLGATGAPPASPAPPAPRARVPQEAPEPVATQAASVEGGEADPDPRAAVEALVAALASAAGIDLRARVTLSADTLLVELAGRDAASFLLGPSEPPVAEAFEHLLFGMFAHQISPRRLRVECEGQREHREEKLRATALALGAAVLADGQARTTDPLNAYERRLVHMAVAEQPRLITYSVGGGADRRVTIAPEKASLGGEVY